MKRKVIVTVPGIRVEAVLSSKGDLLRHEAEEAIESLASHLIEAVRATRFFETPLCRVRVRM